MLRKIIVILACHFEPAIYQTCLILLGEKKKGRRRLQIFKVLFKKESQLQIIPSLFYKAYRFF